MTDEQLIEEYSKEIFGPLYTPECKVSVKQLIEHSRTLRDINGERTKIIGEAYREGYKLGKAMAASNSMTADQLANMTVQQFVNFVGTSND